MAPAPAPDPIPKGLRGQSRAERRFLRARRRPRPGATGAEIADQAYKVACTAKRHSRMILSHERAMAMVTQLAEDFYRDLQTVGVRPLSPYERKQIATAWAVVMDKWTILKGLPIATVKVEAGHLDAVVALGDAIARALGGQAAAEDVEGA